MAISRKDFLKSAALISGGVIFGLNKLSGRSAHKLDGFRELRNNIGIYSEKGGTIGWYVSKDYCAVIDTQFPDSAEHFYSGLREKTSRNIDFLFNTHHHRDHTSGNYFLKKYADNIIAQENCPRLQKEAYGSGDKAGMQVYADMTFKTEWQRDLGKEIINVKYLGPAHTGGDSIIYFEKANIAHIGDLVFNNVYPYIDLPGGGSIKNWIVVLEKAADLYPADTTFIFGHASEDNLLTGTKKQLLRMRDYFNALLDFVSKLKKEGKSFDEMKKAENIPGFESIKVNRPGAVASNIDSAYQELNK